MICLKPHLILQTLLPALLQKLVGEFLKMFGREIWRDFLRIFSDPQKKGSKDPGIISEHFS